LECFYLFPENTGVEYVPGQVLECYLFLDQSRSIICSKTSLGVLSVPGPALQSLLFVPESALKYCLILNQPRSTFCSWPLVLQCSLLMDIPRAIVCYWISPRILSVPGAALELCLFLDQPCSVVFSRYSGVLSFPGHPQEC
jgi:hypothetical protein